MLSLILSVVLAVSQTTSFQADVRAARGDAIRSCVVLQAVAERRVVQIETDFSHWNPGAVAARTPLRYWSWGEILAWNSYPDGYAAAGAVQQFLQSPPHRAIMLGRWTCFGAAAAKANGHWYFVGEFGVPPRTARPPAPRAVVRRVAPRYVPPRHRAVPVAVSGWWRGWWGPRHHWQ